MTSEVLTVRVKSESDPAREYTLHANGDAATCSCPGYTAWKKCKHVTALLAVLREERDAQS